MALPRAMQFRDPLPEAGHVVVQHVVGLEAERLDAADEHALDLVGVMAGIDRQVPVLDDGGGVVRARSGADVDLLASLDVLLVEQAQLARVAGDEDAQLGPLAQALGADHHRGEVRRGVPVHVRAEIREREGGEGRLEFPGDQEMPKLVQADAQAPVGPDTLAPFRVRQREDRVQPRCWRGIRHQGSPATAGECVGGDDPKALACEGVTWSFFILAPSHMERKWNATLSRARGGFQAGASRISQTVKRSNGSCTKEGRMSLDLAPKSREHLSGNFTMGFVKNQATALPDVNSKLLTTNLEASASIVNVTNSFHLSPSLTNSRAEKTALANVARSLLPTGRQNY